MAGYSQVLDHRFERTLNINEEIKGFNKTIKSMSEFNRIEFIILYGSAARGDAISGSDIDLCIYYNADEKEDLSRFRLDILSRLKGSVFDIRMFQQLPLYVRVEVLKGRIIYTREQSFLYGIALDTIREFESFKPRFHDYIYR
ncbi:MAG: nucleotidyltransferase domain-containing protein [Methanosarcinales archaeon]|nr:nucleotidyltransferase domain-containing protein [Methanosarcinales archaeon]